MSAVSRRTRTLLICTALVAALLAAAAFAPLPVTIAVPGMTADVLGTDRGKPVITISGKKTRETSGELRMTTIAATLPDATIRSGEVIEAWFATDEAAMPRDAVYPSGDSTEEIERYNEQQMTRSQNAASTAALEQLGLSSSDVEVKLNLQDVGGPSAGLMFSLGIIAKIAGDGEGGDLTGGRSIAGTGTITPDGTVGPVGGVPLKTRGAARDGATVFLVPVAECEDAEVQLPEGLRLIPVETLDGALRALEALESGGNVPGC